MENRLVAVITGAAGGIGQLVAKYFATNNKFGDVVIVDSLAKKEELATIAGALNSGVFPAEASVRDLTCDVVDNYKCENLVTNILINWGRIDVLVNAAGIAQEFGPLVKTDFEKARRVMNVNFWGTLNMCRAVLPHMRISGHGRIVNVSSIAAQRGDPGNLVYAASKAAIESLTKTLAHEAPFDKGGSPLNITVNAVAPGIIDTPMANLLSEKVKEGYRRMNPTGRTGRPEEVAKVIHWLATEAPQYVNGEIIRVDGGFLA